MKNLSLRILATMMALLLIVGLAACGGGDDTSSDTPSISESETPSGDNGNAGDETPDTPDTPDTPADKTTQKPTGNKTTTTKKQTDATTTANPNKETNLTWAQVKAKLPANAKGKKLVVVDWNPTSEMPGMDKTIEKFEKETGIDVDYQVINYSIYFSKLTANVTAQTAPDAARLQNVNRQNLVNFQPINKLGYNFNDKAWDDTVLDAYTFNGNIYGVNMVGSPYYSPYLMFYNTKLIEEFGYDDPYKLWKQGKWSWKDVWEMAEDYTENGGKGAKGLTTMADMSYMSAYGTPTITFDKKTGTFGHNLNNQNWVKAFQEWCDKYTAGLMTENLTNNDMFDASKVLFNISMGLAARDGASYFKKLKKEGAVGVVPLPALTDGGKAYQKLGEVQAFGVPKTAKNGNLTPYFLRCYFDSANYDMNNLYAVKNAKEVIDAVRNSNPQINYDSAILNPEAMGELGSEAGFHNHFRNQGSENVISNRDSMLPTVEASIADMNAFFKKL